MNTEDVFRNTVVDLLNQVNERNKLLREVIDWYRTNKIASSFGLDEDTLPVELIVRIENIIPTISEVEEETLEEFNQKQAPHKYIGY